MSRLIQHWHSDLASRCTIATVTMRYPQIFYMATQDKYFRSITANEWLIPTLAALTMSHSPGCWWISGTNFLHTILVV
jgi:hypothetical protein